MTSADTFILTFSIPSLQPSEDTFLPRYNVQSKIYTRIHDKYGPAVDVMSNLRPNKLSFWNKMVPEMFQHQMGRKSDYKVNNSDVISTHLVTYNTNKNTWILTSVCICLTVLTVVLTISYYNMRKEVTRLMRQSSISSAERMLPQI